MLSSVSSFGLEGRGREGEIGAEGDASIAGGGDEDARIAGGGDERSWFGTTVGSCTALIVTPKTLVATVVFSKTTLSKEFKIASSVSSTGVTVV